MTIKELCNSFDFCDKDCPFNPVCSYNDAYISCSDEYDKILSKAIIETAKILQESSKSDN